MLLPMTHTSHITMIKFLDLKAINDLHREQVADAVARVAACGWYLRGEQTRLFEEEYARYIGTRCCVGCGNGLDALTLIMRAYMELGVMEPGDEVIVPANTYIASMLAVTRCRLRPVLVEPDPDTLQISPALIEQAVTPRTRAVMIVHLYGKCAYTHTVGEVCRRHGLKLIEDNAQAHGCRYHQPHDEAAVSSDCRDGLRTGALGDAAAHSFYPTKNLGALGDAGAVTTSDETLADMVRALANYGSARKYVFDHIGMNSRIDEIQAAVLRVKMGYVDEENAIRRRNALIYFDTIRPGSVRLMPRGYASDNVFHIFPVLCSRRDELREWLLGRGIQTNVHYPIPPHRQKCYADMAELRLPITEGIHRDILSLPVNQTLSPDDIRTVAEAINHFNAL